MNLFVTNLSNPQHTSHGGTFETLASFDPTDLLGIFLQAIRKFYDRQAGTLAHLHEQKACSMDTSRFFEVKEFACVLQEVLRRERVESIPIKCHHSRP